MSPVNYLIELRLNRAKELLKYTPLPVNEIALSVGIANPYYFSRLFKKHTGTSPTEYRKESPSVTRDE